MNADGYSGDRRRHQRFTHPPVCLAFEGRSYTTTDWSLGGFVIDDYEGSLTPGSLFSIAAVGAAGASMTPVDIRSRVVRTNHDKRVLTVSFLVIDKPGYAVLRALVGDRMKLFGADLCSNRHFRDTTGMTMARQYRWSLGPQLDFPQFGRAGRPEMMSLAMP